MNDLAKNLMLWVVVAVVLMVVFQSFSPKMGGGQEVVYSQFVDDVANDRIRKVDLNLDFASVYGPQWAFLKNAPPISVAWAKGSTIEVYPHGRV